MSVRRTVALSALALLPLTGCADVRIGSPQSLWMLWLVPATLAFYAYVFRAKRRLLERFASAEMLRLLTAGVSRGRQVLKAALVLGGIAGLVLALAQLRWGFTWEEVKRQGVDIVVALDVSDSMLVRDAEAGGELSRLDRAKREIADLLNLLQGDRIGLVAFAGTAFVECPLTLDYSAASLFLDAIDTELIPVKGTAIGTAIRESVKAFEGGAHSSRAIILITDGEDHSGQALQAAEEAKVAGVRIFTIGIGRDEGAPIPDAGGGFRRDRRGEIVLSKLDEPSLQKIALTTGGAYVRSVTGDVDLERIYSQGIKATLEDQELGSKRRQRWEERFQWALGFALVCLAAEPLISERQRRRQGLAAVLLAFLLGALPAAAQNPPAPTPAAPSTAKAEGRRIGDPYDAYAAGVYDQALQGFVDRQVERPEDADLLFNVASAHYKMKSYPEAEKAFATVAVSGDTALREQALYNLGNCAFRQGRLDAALEMYKAALDLDPEDQDAKFNLEFVRDEIRRRHEEAQKRQQEQQKQQQNQQDQQQQQDQNQQQQDQQQGQNQEQQEGGEDSDRDGLSDQTEKGGQNPTDPQDPDSDDDRLADGQEDANRNGQVDPGETDPNQADSDGDGVADAEEAAAQESAGEQGEEQENLSPEEAERYLQALQEGRPQRKEPARRGGQRRVEKDW